MSQIKPGYTRVSEVLSMWTNFKNIPADVLERKTEIGTKAHQAIASYLDDIPIDVSFDVEGYVESFKKWFDFVVPEVIEIESRMYCDEYMLTGACDAKFKMPGEDSYTIVDWKTTASSHDPIWKMQAGFYHYLSTLKDRNASERVLFIKLDKDGKMPKVKEFTIDETMYELCLNALQQYRYFQSFGVEF